MFCIFEVALSNIFVLFFFERNLSTWTIASLQHKVYGVVSQSETVIASYHADKWKV